MLSRAGNQKGFTLVEFMAGLLILAIVIAFGLPSYRTWIQNTAIRTTAESIRNGLQLARAEAVARNMTVRFRFDEGAAWTVCVPTADACNLIESRRARDGATAAVTVTANPDEAVNFTSMGQGTAISIDIDVDPQVMSADESHNLRVVVNGGSIRVCDPNVTAANDVRAC